VRWSATSSAVFAPSTGPNGPDASVGRGRSEFAAAICVTVRVEYQLHHARLQYPHKTTMPTKIIVLPAPPTGWTIGLPPCENPITMVATLSVVTRTRTDVRTA